VLGIAPTAWFRPRNLREALPNRTYTVPGKATFTYSDVAIIGRITSAETGAAFAHAGDDVLVPVDFDDSSAAEHALDVGVAVDEWFGDGEPASKVSFRIGSLGSRDRELFLDGLRSLDRVAVTLQKRQDRDGKVLIATEQGALIGRIDGSRPLWCPGLGLEEHGFVAGTQPWTPIGRRHRKIRA
jgi:hypothetical protein